jgi:HSP20 family molecular chaperone IbpA
MNQKIKCLIDGGFISINDVLEHAGYLENQMDEYYQEQYAEGKARELDEEEKNKKEDYVRKEFNYQSFYRSFSLPDYVDENKIDANYKDGILHVTVSKKEGSKKKALKNIPIK